MDTALANVGIWCQRSDTCAAHERHPYQPEDIEGTAHSIPKGGQQQLYVGNEFEYNQLSPQAKES